MEAVELKLRTEQPADYRETENVTREAFWNLYSPGCCEHYLLHVMRDSPAFVPELDLVAERDGRIVGNVVSLRAVLHGDDGTVCEVLSLGPISVLPECQRQGIGGRLISRTRELARELGFRALLLCGDPDYYLYQGFVPAEMLGIRTADNMYAMALHVCELYDGALSGIRGRYVEDSIYDIDPPPPRLSTGSFLRRESCRNGVAAAFRRDCRRAAACGVRNWLFNLKIRKSCRWNSRFRKESWRP